MYESGYYPAGAEHDPSAPWNEREPKMVKCAACGGTGIRYYAYNFNIHREAECTQEEYLRLPDEVGDAIIEDKDVIKGIKELCDVCDGNGEVENEPDYDDHDEYDEY